MVRSVDEPNRSREVTEVRYKEVHNKVHASSAKSRRRNYMCTIVISDSEGEQGTESPLKKARKE